MLQPPSSPLLVPLLPVPHRTAPANIMLPYSAAYNRTQLNRCTSVCSGCVSRAAGVGAGATLFAVAAAAVVALVAAVVAAAAAAAAVCCNVLARPAPYCAAMSAVCARCAATVVCNLPGANAAAAAGGAAAGCCCCADARCSCGGCLW